MLWKDKINEWNNGIVVKYPSNIKNRFYFETSVCNKKLDSKYKEEFIEDIKKFGKDEKNETNEK